MKKLLNKKVIGALLVLAAAVATTLGAPDTVIAVLQAAIDFVNANAIVPVN